LAGKSWRAQRKFDEASTENNNLERKTNDETRALWILCAKKKLKAHIISDVSFEYADIMYMLILAATDPPPSPQWK
jgi:hypothetical protein